MVHLNRPRAIAITPPSPDAQKSTASAELDKKGAWHKRLNNNYPLIDTIALTRTTRFASQLCPSAEQGALTGLHTHC